jgi:hypothetical protein
LSAADIVVVPWTIPMTDVSIALEIPSISSASSASALPSRLFLLVSVFQDVGEDFLAFR